MRSVELWVRQLDKVEQVMHLVHLVIEKSDDCLYVPYYFATLLLVKSVHHNLAFIFLVEKIEAIRGSD